MEKHKGAPMSTHFFTTEKYDLDEVQKTSILIGKLPRNAQFTTKDTGWSEEEKDRMRQTGYDGVDIVRAWYN